MFELQACVTMPTCVGQPLGPSSTLSTCQAELIQVDSEKKNENDLHSVLSGQPGSQLPPTISAYQPDGTKTWRSLSRGFLGEEAEGRYVPATRYGTTSQRGARASAQAGDS